jgi:hypothetical protein
LLNTTAEQLIQVGLARKRLGDAHQGRHIEQPGAEAMAGGGDRDLARLHEKATRRSPPQSSQ